MLILKYAGPLCDHKWPRNMKYVKFRSFWNMQKKGFKIVYKLPLVHLVHLLQLRIFWKYVLSAFRVADIRTCKKDMVGVRVLSLPATSTQSKTSFETRIKPLLRFLKNILLHVSETTWWAPLNILLVNKRLKYETFFLHNGLHSF